MDPYVMESELSERSDYLKRIPQFSILDETGRNQLAGLLQKQHCDTGYTFFYQGNDTSAMYFIVEGSVDVLKEDVSVAHIGADNFFGEVGILTDRPRNATVKAISNTVYYVLSDFLLKKLVEDEPVIALFFERVLKARS